MVFAALRRFSRHCIATPATLVALMIAVGGCAGLEMKERELLFRPTREAAGWYGGMPEAVQEIYLPVGTSAPGERIHAWWWPADDPHAPVVFYLHGVRWNLGYHSLNSLSSRESRTAQRTCNSELAPSADQRIGFPLPGE